VNFGIYWDILFVRMDYWWILETLTQDFMNMSTPTSVTKLKRFVKVVGFYQHYLKNFVAKATPMYKLLKDI
jgi:hypothetical protein